MTTLPKIFWTFLQKTSLCSRLFPVSIVTKKFGYFGGISPFAITCDQTHYTKSEDWGSVAECSARGTRNPVPGWRPLAGFVLCCPEFKSSATLENSQLIASRQLEFLILLCSICIICFRIISVMCL